MLIVPCVTGLDLSNIVFDVTMIVRSKTTF